MSDGNSNLSYETQTSDYGLDLAENTFSPWLQSDTLSIGNFELEPTQINNSDSHELVFIDSTVRDAQTLIDNISGAAEIIVLNDEQDELVQISEHLKDYQQLDAVHIVSHGESGELSFGNATLNSDTLPEYKKTIEEWSLALDEDADLLLYGCEVTLDGKGSSFVQELSLLTQADISASVDDTGISGDWELETAIGEIEATSVFTEEIENAYQHDLADVESSLSVGFDGGGGSSGDDGSGTLDAFDDQVNDELSGGGDDDDDDDDDVSFEGDRFFDADFYLAQNPDVAEAGVDPARHYYETGFKEGRDPNKVFDTSFYLAQNPDVAEAGVNPLEHYYTNRDLDSLERYPNIVLQSFDESRGALVVPSSINGSQFEEFKDLSEQVTFAAAALAIPIVIVGGTKVLAITAITLGIIKAASTIEDLLGAEDVEVFVPEGDIDTSTPPFDLGSISKLNDNNSLPNGVDFVEGILEGRYEFPSADGGGAYFLAVDVYDDSQGFRQSPKPDPAADVLAEKLGGKSRQIFNSDSTTNKEFDVISDEYIAETKEGRPKVNKDLRVQAKRAFEAAQQTGRKVYYEFENPPRDEVVRRLNEYSERYGVELTINVLNP